MPIIVPYLLMVAVLALGVTGWILAGNRLAERVIARGSVAAFRPLTTEVRAALSTSNKATTDPHASTAGTRE